MSEKDYQRLMDIAAEALEEARRATKEESLAVLIDAGILDENGNFTKPYENLGRYMNSQNKK